MKRLLSTGIAISAAVFSGSIWAADSAASQAWRRLSSRSQQAVTAAERGSPVPPAVAADLPRLQFREFFGPVGDRGLEYSARLHELEGKQVRLTGYMVREPNRCPGMFLFAGRPARVQQSSFCTYDDLPTATVHVMASGAADRPIPFQPGALELTGRLELGPRLEADGRNSAVRLVLDASASAALLGERLASAPANPTSPSSINDPTR